MGWEGPMTYRQFRVWNKWMQMQWNEPDRHDYYLMQIASEINKKNRKRAVRLDRFKIPFKWKVVKQKIKKAGLSLAEMSKNIWMGRLRSEDLYVDEQGRTRLRIRKNPDKRVESDGK